MSYLSRGGLGFGVRDEEEFCGSDAEEVPADAKEEQGEDKVGEGCAQEPNGTRGPENQEPAAEHEAQPDLVH